jgi:predicted amidohydrolase
VAGTERRVFDVDGVTFGITICHEGWRYPEATRWAAVRGAQVVFHPHFTGSDVSGPSLTTWGDPTGPYYEKAMIARAAENSIYFASVNNALRYQESATSLIGPEGELDDFVPYGHEALLVADLDLATATRQYAVRFRPEAFA